MSAHKSNIVGLRDVTESDLYIFFEQQLDSEGNHMAAFTGKDPTDRAAFDARWEKIFNSAIRRCPAKYKPDFKIRNGLTNLN